MEDAEGRPRPGAHVQLLGSLGRQAGPRPLGRAEEDGLFALDGLAPDAYTVIVRAPGHVGPHPWPVATVVAGTTARLTVTLAPAGKRRDG